MNGRDAVMTRRSCRKYLDKPVEREKLELIVEAGRVAPTGSNSQTTHFIVVQNKEVLDTLERLVQEQFAKMEEEPGMYRSMANAIKVSKQGRYVFHRDPAVLIITANRIGYGNAMADCACALENMFVMANELDLGSCYINALKWLSEDPVLIEYEKSLGMADDERVFGAAAIGYPDTKDGLPPRNDIPHSGNPVTWVE
ncbi:MAG: nitroreductase family protein [Lachnospiraceae bacterium]|nr:nitroreductase family protein [Lachnospiraceae bacterium]